ncbi:unnamed protein product, partial [Ectocarpus sp. 13 AM-2016]
LADTSTPVHRYTLAVHGPCAWVESRTAAAARSCLSSPPPAAFSIYLSTANLLSLSTEQRDIVCQQENSGIRGRKLQPYGGLGAAAHKRQVWAVGYAGWESGVAGHLPCTPSSGRLVH